MAAFHGLEVDFFEADAAAGDEFVFVGGLALDLVSAGGEFLNEFVFSCFGKLGPGGVWRDCAVFEEAFPEAPGECVEAFGFDLGGSGSLAELGEFAP